MADDPELDFEDRYSDVPVPTPDDEESTAKKKADLLKLATPPSPLGPKEELRSLLTPIPAPTIPPPPLPPAPEPKSFVSRLLGITAPPMAAPPPPPLLPPKDVAQIAKEIDQAEPPQADIGKLSTGQIRSEGLIPNVASPSQEVKVRAAQSGIPAAGMALLDTIATREAEPAFKNGQRAGWTTMVGGKQFDPNTRDHPHIAYPGMPGFVGGAGRSYASGRYQETTATYYENVDRSEKLHPGVNVTGWSEEAQNIRNWDKAQDVYRRYAAKNPNANLSGDLLTDLQNNKDDPAIIGRMSRALSAEWTSAPGGKEGSKQTGGKESYYGNTFVNMLANAQGQPGGDPAFLNPQPSATQNVPLTGGLSNTPAAAAQTAALMTGTPIEKIKAIADVMSKAAARGAAGGKPPQLPITVAGQRVKQMPEGVLPQQGSVTHTPPNALPIPGMPAVHRTTS
jgi:muramidase (phage lysozyme)